MMIDGVEVKPGDRVLIKNVVVAAGNGKDVTKSKLRRAFADYVEECRIEFVYNTNFNTSWKDAVFSFRGNVEGASKILEMMDAKIDMEMLSKWLYGGGDDAAFGAFRKSSAIKLSKILIKSTKRRANNGGCVLQKQCSDSKS